MTKSEVEAILARAEKATPGPWRVEHDKKVCSKNYHANCKLRCHWDPPRDGTIGFELAEMSGGGLRLRDDGKFIAHARTDLPALAKAYVEAMGVLESLLDHVRMADAFEEVQIAHRFVTTYHNGAAAANDNPTALSTSPDGQQKGADKAQERGGKL